MIPSHFPILTNVFPTEPAPDGLNYYFHTLEVPSALDVSRMLHDTYLHTGRFAGLRTSAQFLPVHIQWKRESLNVVEHDLLHDLGYNYVGCREAYGPVVWGHHIQGSPFSLPEVISIPDLIACMLLLRINTATERKWISMGAPELIVQKMMHHMVHRLTEWAQDSVANRSLIEAKVITNDVRSGCLSIGIRVYHQFDLTVIDFDLNTGKWIAHSKARELIKAAFSVFPELVDEMKANELFIEL